jgi:predicted HicB family RNase H-like nuclease
MKLILNGLLTKSMNKNQTRGGTRDGAGRPKNSEPSTTVQFRCSNHLKAQFAAAADRQNMTISEWLINAAMRALTDAQ